MRKTSSEENVKRQPSNKVALFADCASNNVEENNDQNIATDCFFFGKVTRLRLAPGRHVVQNLHKMHPPTHIPNKNGRK